MKIIIDFFNNHKIESVDFIETVFLTTYYTITKTIFQQYNLASNFLWVNNNWILKEIAKIPNGTFIGFPYLVYIGNIVDYM